MTKSKSVNWSVAAAILSILAYIITWRFYAMWWFIIAFFNLGIFLFYLTAFLASIVFWINNRKSTNYPYTALCINLLTVLIIICAPSTNRNKNYPKLTVDLFNAYDNNCNCKLHIELYCIYGGGATTTDLDAVYLTDSTNFRVYIGEYDEGNQQIAIKCHGDYITSVKTTTEGIDTNWGDPIVLERKSFSLKQLINDHSFQ